MLTFFTLRARPSEQKIDYLAQKYQVSKEAIEIAIAVDPTEKVYVEWLLRLVAKGRFLNNQKFRAKLRKSLELFHRLKEQPVFKDSKDINSYTSAEALMDCVEAYKHYHKVPTDQQKREIKSNARVVIRENSYTWFQITTPEQGRILSSGTSWCTLGDEHTLGYLEFGRLYVCYTQSRPTLMCYMPNPGTTNNLYEFPDVANIKNEDIIMDFDGHNAILESKKYIKALNHLKEVEGFEWDFVGPAGV
jgi:hypothetical protein